MTEKNIEWVTSPAPRRDWKEPRRKNIAAEFKSARAHMHFFISHFVPAGAPKSSSSSSCMRPRRRQPPSSWLHSRAREWKEPRLEFSKFFSGFSHPRPRLFKNFDLRIRLQTGARHLAPPQINPPEKRMQSPSRRERYNSLFFFQAHTCPPCMHLGAFFERFIIEPPHPRCCEKKKPGAAPDRYLFSSFSFFFGGVLLHFQRCCCAVCTRRGAQGEGSQ